MKYEVKVPTVGESITEATIGQWMKKNGEAVKRNDVLMMIETDKATVEVVAEHDGVLQVTVEAGKPIPIGTVVAFIDSEGKASVAAAATPAAPARPTAPTVTTAAPSTPAPSAPSAPVQSGRPAPVAPMSAAAQSTHPDLRNHLSPAVQKIVAEKGLDPAQIHGTGRGGRLTKEDVMNAQPGSMGAGGMGAGATMMAAPERSTAKPGPSATAVAPSVNMTLRGPSKQGDQKRVAMTTIRKRIAERLVMSQQTTATLTTFNEIDMTRVMELRAKYKDKFKERYGLSLGFMGFFVKACIEALKAFPAANAFIDGTDVIYNNYFNVGVAVSTEKGLIVPVIKDADNMSIAQVEAAIKDFAVKGKEGKISIEDLNGGTFTVTNGGVFGSLMSTPILNPPQSAILGMHKIQERPMAIDGKVEIRPMMYVALSYDHRMIDGREAVGFLVKVKECVEDPERLLLEI